MKTLKRKNALKWIFKYTKGQLFRVAFLSVITGLIAFGFIWLAVVSKKVLDIATGDDGGNIFLHIGIIFFIIGMQAFLNVIYANIVIRTVGKTDIAIKQGVFSKLLQKKWTAVNKFHSGEIINRLTSDVDIVVNGVVDILPTAIALLTRLIAGLIVLFSIDAKFTAIAVGVGLFVFVCAKIYSKHFKYLHKNLQSANGEVRSFLQECFENIIVIKSFANDENIRKRLSERQNKALKIMYKKQTVSNVANTGVYVLFTGSYYAALIWGAFSIGKGVITFGTLTAFLQIIEQIKAPMANISGLVPKFYSMVASAERLMDLEVLQDETREGSSEAAFYKDIESIVIDKVSFSYKDESVLKNASAVIKKGEFVAISGRSGIGKSTVMKLLLNLIEPNKGSVYFKCKNKDVTIDAGHRGLFAYVPQGNMILSGTLKENIAFCNPSASDEEIVKAAKLSMLWDFIQSLPEKENTIIGERGLGLSEGQTQRLAIARAILTDAPILLLDEATSALDEENEVKLIENLKKLKNKTCIFISHRQKTLEMCESILTMEDGKLLKS
ncbi:MAG: ABC transporter ATP-binding protein [Firmicutes bacterium]|nr:ABC transporter ATP-binding protein [Bacillota bacterium]